jgi:hypothetical protein
VGRRRGVREPRRAITEIVLSKTPKDAQKALAEAKFKRKEVQARDASKAMAEYEAAQVATRQKTARLKELREAKEAADRETAEREAAEEPKAAGKKKRL